MSYQMTQEELNDELFWDELDAELRAEKEKELNYIASLTVEEYYRQYVLPGVLAEEEEYLQEPSIEVI